MTEVDTEFINRSIDQDFVRQLQRNRYQANITRRNRVGIAALSFVFGILGSVLHYMINDDIHHSYQRFVIGFAAFISICIVLPLVEEVTKKLGLMLAYQNKITWLWGLVPILLVAYGFQIMEAFFFFIEYNERQVWMRFILPLHMLFTLVTVRHGLLKGAGLHGLWNMQLFLPHHNLVQLGFIVFSYLLFISLLQQEYLKHGENKIIANTLMS